MELTIVGGTGGEGRGIATRFALAGAPVLIGSRDAARAAETAAVLRARHPGIEIEGASNAEAIARGDVIVLTIPFAHADATIAANADAFRPGSLVIDVTVPVIFEGGRPVFVAPPEGSAAEHIRARLPPSVALACAFKTLPARLLEHAELPLDCDDFICGDSTESQERAAALVGRIRGLRPVNVGGLDMARILERMTLLAIVLNKRYRSHAARFQVLGI